MKTSAGGILDRRRARALRAWIERDQMQQNFTVRDLAYHMGAPVETVLHLLAARLGVSMTADEVIDGVKAARFLDTVEADPEIPWYTPLLHPAEETSSNVVRSGVPRVPLTIGQPGLRPRGGTGGAVRRLTKEERDARLRALQDAASEAEQRRTLEAERRALQPEPETVGTEPESVEEEVPEILDAETLRQRELEDLDAFIQEAERAQAEEAERHRQEEEAHKGPSNVAAGDLRKGGKMMVSQALSDERSERTRSLAAVRRARERERLMSMQENRKYRDVVLPEVITVRGLANRMAEPGADVIKALMSMGVMATINQTIDADTAELVINEFGHRMRRVSEADVEIGMQGNADADETLTPRAPIVTIMGHVDHGKTTLLDALRQTDVVSREADGITQPIGAYQVMLESGAKITFIDKPGHAAFTEMRARGANVTDVVVLVVAANDGVMPQTAEAIHHAKAAKVPIIVAINKIDLPDAKPDRVRQELFQHELVVESLGGDVLDVEISAKTKLNLERLEEAIVLQAEILELRANANRAAEGVVVEAKLERGRGSVATVLVQHGTLKVGDMFVAGSEWGRVRALIDDRGQLVTEAGPAVPVEVLGLSGTPLAGENFIVVQSEQRAREIAEFHTRKKRDVAAAATARLDYSGTLDRLADPLIARWRDIPRNSEARYRRDEALRTLGTAAGAGWHQQGAQPPLQEGDHAAPASDEGPSEERSTRPREETISDEAFFAFLETAVAETDATSLPDNTATAELAILGGPAVIGRAIATPDDLVRAVEAGFRVETVEALGAAGFTPGELDRLVVPARTLARRRREGRLSSPESDVAWRLARALGRAETVLGDRGRAFAWLRRPNRSFADSTPLGLLKTEAGGRRVEELLLRAEFGMLA